MIYTNQSTCKLISDDINKFNCQYGGLTDSTVKEILTVRSEGTRKVSRKI